MNFVTIYIICVIGFIIFMKLSLWFVDNLDDIIDFFGLGKQADKLEKKLAKKFIKQRRGENNLII